MNIKIILAVIGLIPLFLFCLAAFVILIYHAPAAMAVLCGIIFALITAGWSIKTLDDYAEPPVDKDIE